MMINITEHIPIHGIYSLLSTKDELLVDVQTDETKGEWWCEAKLATDYEFKKCKFDSFHIYFPLTVRYSDNVIVDEWYDIEKIKVLIGGKWKSYSDPLYNVHDTRCIKSVDPLEHWINIDIKKRRFWPPIFEWVYEFEYNDVVYWRNESELKIVKD